MGRELALKLEVDYDENCSDSSSQSTVAVIMDAKYVVVDSHIHRFVLATEETTVTQQVSHRPIKCQSRLWSQRGTKVNGSHRGDNTLLRPQRTSPIY